MLVDISEVALRAAESQLAAEGHTVVALSGDAASPDVVAEAVSMCVARFGSLDHVHANAGIGTPGLAVDVADDAWSRVIDVNLSGAFRLARAKLATRTPGTITFTSSPHGLATTPGAAAYAASKSALLGLTRGPGP